MVGFSCDDSAARQSPLLCAPFAHVAYAEEQSRVSYVFRALTLCVCHTSVVRAMLVTFVVFHSVSLSLIRMNVYNADYVDEHPGGSAILRNAGRDSTEGFLGACVYV